HARLEFPPVGERHAHVRGAIHHMIIGQDVTFRADDDTRTKPLRAAFARRIELLPLLAEKTPEEGIHFAVLRKSRLHYLRRRNTDYRGQYPLHHRSEAVAARGL